MSQTTSTSSSNFRTIFVTAIKAYEKKTKTDLLIHPLATQLQSCNSSSDILAVLHDKVNEFDESRRHNERLSSWLKPTINVLYAFSATLGEGVGLIFSPANVISAGVGVLLLAAKDIDASEEALADLFERIENFFKRLESYTEVPPTDAMTDINVKIIVEILNIFAIATKEMKQGRAKKFLKKLVGRKDIEDALKRLDKLTQEEARMAAAQILKLTHAVDSKVTGVGNKLKEMEDKMDVVIKDGMDAKVVLQKTSNNVDDMKWNQLRDCLRKWVTPPDPSTNHNIACDIHHGGTAEWFSQGGIFAEWKSDGSLLWIYGKPGSGKSILCSTIIQDVECLREAGSAMMAYFYFDFRDLEKQHRRNLLPSLLIQLSAQSLPCCDILFQLYTVHDNGEKRPSDKAMSRCLRDMLTISNPRPVYIILDALDECPNWPGIPSPREQTLSLVKELVDLRLPYLHICVTSRPEFDIRATLAPLAHHQVSLHEESGQKKDIVDYINSVVYSDSETMMKRWRDDEKKLVIEALSEKADGMFRWVFCQLDTLRQCLPSSVRPTLEQLPESLDETYERIVVDIKKANKGQAYRMLQCLAVAIRPLSVAELAELLAFEFDAAKGGIPKLNADWRWEDHEQAVLSTCSSLITIVPDGDDSPIVQFSHFSVKEFLLSDRLATSSKDVAQYRIVLEDANTLIASACLGVLLQDPVDENGSATAPLAPYAAEHWVTHAQVKDVASRVRDGMERLFDPDSPHFSAWVKLFDVDTRHWIGDPQMKILPGAAPLYYAARCGLHGIAEHLVLKYPEYANAIGGEAGTALHTASFEGHIAVVRALLKCGVDVDARGRWNMSPLELASAEGRLDVVEYLLDHGADPNFQDNEYYITPLYRAAVWSRLETVRVLLERHADPNAQDKEGLTAMHAALLNGDPKGDFPPIVRLLVEYGANPNVRDNLRRTPLHLVSDSSSRRWEVLGLSVRLEIARTLLSHGADVGAEDEEGRTPLQCALASKETEMTELLSEHCSK